MTTVRKKLLSAVFVLIAIISFVVGEMGLEKKSSFAIITEGNCIKVTGQFEEGSSNGAYITYSLLNWIDEETPFAVGDTLVYEVYSPNKIPGIGGVDGQFTGIGNNSFMLFNKVFQSYNIKDENGYDAACSTDLSEHITNGWYTRKIPLPVEFTGYATLPYRIGHIAVTVDIPSGIELPEKIEVYYKNIRLERADGTTHQIIRSNITIPSNPVILNPNNAKPNKEAFSIEHVSALEIPKINELSIPKGLYVGEEYDFSKIEYDFQGEANTSFSYKVNGEWRNDLKYVPETAGKDLFEFFVEKDGIQVSLSKEINVFEDKNAIYFFEDEMEELIGKLKAEPGETVEFDKVFAFYKGEHNLPVRLILQDSKGVKYSVEEVNGKYLLTFPEKYEAEFIFLFIAQADGKSESFTISVNIEGDKNPKIDVSEVPTDIECGKMVVLPDVKAEDFHDGELPVNVKVLDPFGEEVTLNENSFYACVAGAYEIEYTAEDSEGNETVEKVKLNAGKIVGQVLKFRVFIPDSLKAEGVQKGVRVSVYGWMENSYKFKNNDVISYEVYCPQAVAGVGMIDSQLEGNWYMMSKCGYDNLQDQNGVLMGPSGNISEYVQDGWYKRESKIAPEMVAEGTIRHLALSFYTTAAIDSDYIDIYYRNIKVISATGSEFMLYNGLHQVKPAYINSKSNGFSEMKYQLYSVVSPTPMVDISQIKETYGTKEEILLPDKLINYYTREEVKNFVITGLDPDFEAFAIDGNRFKANKVGTYTFVYKNVDGAEKQFSETFSIYVVDDCPPEMSIVGEAQNSVKKGKKVSLPEVKISDDVDPDRRLKVKYEVLSPAGKEVEIGEDNTFKAVESGVYKVKIIGQDVSKNESIIEYNVVSKGGCAAVFDGADGGIMVFATLGAIAVIVLGRKKRNADR